MNKQEYLSVKQQLSFEKPLWVTLITMLFQYSLLALGIFFLSLDGFFFFVLSQVILALFFFHSFAMLHEAGHDNIHKSRWINTLVGHLYSVTCFMPFFAWKHMHQGHHVWTGSINKDPGSRTLLKLKKLGKVPKFYDTSWRLWIPLPAIAQHMRLWVYPYHLVREEKKDSRAITQAFFSIGFLITAYTILYAAFPEVIALENFALAIALYMVLTEIINVPHHVGMPHFYSTPEKDKLHPWEQHIATRSCHYPGFLSEMIALNFNLHTEHHYFPSLPWYRLKKLRSLLKPRLGGEYTEVSDFGWNRKNRLKHAQEVIMPELKHAQLSRAD
jgi:fatty acid desaturase